MIWIETQERLRLNGSKKSSRIKSEPLMKIAAAKQDKKIAKQARKVPCDMPVADGADGCKNIESGDLIFPVVQDAEK